MEGNGSEYRCWDELIPDALGLIFKNLSLQETLLIVPRVCKSWRLAVLGPYCWQEIDIDEWSRKRPPQHIDRMLRMLITRSSGSLRKLSVSGIPNDSILQFLADHAGSLQTLQMPKSQITDSAIEQISSKFSALTSLDLSNCKHLGAPALEAIGKHCKSLLRLYRNVELSFSRDELPKDEEAQAIAATMPKLQHLEIAYHLLTTTESVLKILSNCPDLKCLNLTGCWDVKLDREFLSQKFPNLKVLGPQVMEYYDVDEWEEYCSEYSDEFEYYSWMEDYADDDDDDSYDGMWDNEQQLGELEVRFYEGIGDAGVHGWPPSP